MQYASKGNDNALEDPVTVTYTIEASSSIPFGAIMVYGNVSITADDIDSKFICVIGLAAFMRGRELSTLVVILSVCHNGKSLSGHQT